MGGPSAAHTGSGKVRNLNMHAAVYGVFLPGDAGLEVDEVEICTPLIKQHFQRQQRQPKPQMSCLFCLKQPTESEA